MNSKGSMAEYKKSSAKFTAEVYPCPHCEKGHEVDFVPFSIGEYMGCSHWGMCPEVLDPIPVNVVKGEEDKKEGYDYGEVTSVDDDSDLE